MKGMLAGLGVAGLLCLPCLLVGGVVSLALIGGTLGAVATNPRVQVAGLALVATAAALLWRARCLPRRVASMAKANSQHWSRKRCIRGALTTPARGPLAVALPDRATVQLAVQHVMRQPQDKQPLVLASIEALRKAAVEDSRSSLASDQPRPT